MSEAIIVALITGGLSLAGVFFSNRRAASDMNAKLDKQQAVMAEKLDELTDRVNKHNNLVERTYHLEKEVRVQAEKIKVANHRIDDLERSAE